MSGIYSKVNLVLEVNVRGSNMHDDFVSTFQVNERIRELDRWENALKNTLNEVQREKKTLELFRGLQ